ncbi:hypothetical protein OESDEN_06254 [Oesophagostomum dentatum]|uniref:Globin family profile domain-containing protein n=1 Tax=Oesophagostomum dentatum TaxID=61180 RepID=A0A0B1T8D6_OESDE|nr:hypothetical protein OESDEN_06254 [Oesophagostomum dentatum]
MENMDDREYLQKLLNEIGAHHFFYDACEPHLDIFIDAIMTTMKKQLVGPNKMDEDAEQSWRLLLNDVRTFMSEGIAIQRNVYLRQCMTPFEMADIRSKWEKIVEYGLQEAGEILCETAIQAFDVTVKAYSEETGFCTLPDKVKDFVVKCMVLETCPTFARRAMMEGMFTMLSRIFGDEEFKENVMRTWSKLYRVLEQAIIINIVEY